MDVIGVGVGEVLLVVGGVGRRDLLHGDNIWGNVPDERFTALEDVAVGAEPQVVCHHGEADFALGQRINRFGHDG